MQNHREGRKGPPRRERQDPANFLYQEIPYHWNREPASRSRGRRAGWQSRESRPARRQQFWRTKKWAGRQGELPRTICAYILQNSNKTGVHLTEDLTARSGNLARI